jgi:hypothetical protein
VHLVQRQTGLGSFRKKKSRPILTRLGRPYPPRLCCHACSRAPSGSNRRLTKKESSGEFLPLLLARLSAAKDSFFEHLPNWFGRPGKPSL